MIQSCLDFPPVSFPPPLLARFGSGISAAAPPEPLLAGEDAFSDHVVVTLRSRVRPPGPPPSRPPPPWVVRHLLGRIPQDLHPNDLLRRTKQAIRVASARARDRCLAAHPRPPTARAQLALQVARAAHSADLAILSRCLRRWPALRALATVTTDSVRFTDFTAFYELLASALALAPGSTDFCRDASGAKDSTPSPADTLRSTRSWLRLWLPFAQRTWVATVLPSDGPPTGDGPPDERSPAEILRDHWAPKFAPRECDATLAGALIRVFLPPAPPLVWEPPTIAEVRDFLFRERRSAPGPDQLTREAWFRSGPSAWAAVLALFTSLSAGGRPPSTFNASWAAFLPRGLHQTTPSTQGRGPGSREPPDRSASRIPTRVASRPWSDGRSTRTLRSWGAAGLRPRTHDGSQRRAP